MACDACRKNGGDCVAKDDTKTVIDKVYAADAVIFGTPAYWSGMSSQLKAVIDKFYSKTQQLKGQNKKVGVIAVGTADVADIQYALISDQIRSMMDFLGWDVRFSLSYSATAPGDLQKSEKAAKELSEAWKQL